MKIIAWTIFAIVCITLPLSLSSKKVIIINNEYAEAYTEPIEIIEEISPPVIEYSEVGIFFTYNAEKGQTDGNPRRTASGNEVREGIAANNCLPFGTIIEVEGKGRFEIQDRMNKRYGCDDFDIFKENKKDNFKKTLKYRVI
jgi:3D (Asp-Asp-Asp) domain-containing protein